MSDPRNSDFNRDMAGFLVILVMVGGMTTLFIWIVVSVMANM